MLWKPEDTQHEATPNVVFQEVLNQNQGEKFSVKDSYVEDCSEILEGSPFWISHYTLIQWTLQARAVSCFLLWTSELHDFQLTVAEFNQVPKAEEAGQ